MGTYRLSKYQNFFSIFSYIFIINIFLLNSTIAQTKSVNPNSNDMHRSKIIPVVELKKNKNKAILMVDYLDLSLPDGEEIDLLGYHLLAPVNDWFNIGLGSYAPFLKGEYGGFMAFGAKAHAQRKLGNNIFINAGLDFGGGGGGKSVSHSVILSGTGGYLKSYVGFGYQFEKYSAGINISHLKFKNSIINNTAFNLFVQRPFTYTTSNYSKSGSYYPTSKTQGSKYGEVIGLRLEQISQINPTGSYKGNINIADLQISKFLTKEAYLYYALGVGYSGMPTYNQVLGGFGYRYPLFSNLNLYGQIGIGSGGYAPSRFDTGSGMLIYPKLSIEYKLNNKFGLAMSGGYLYAPDGTSRNNTASIGLNYHTKLSNIRPKNNFEKFRGYHFNFTHETSLDLRHNNTRLNNLNVCSIQLDQDINDNFYIPLRAAISYESYRGYPGYGEISAGIGWHSKYVKDNHFQFFNEIQTGANVEGKIVKVSTGLNYGMSENIALRAMFGLTIGENGFNAKNIGLGVTHRFSLP